MSRNPVSRSGADSLADYRHPERSRELSTSRRVTLLRSSFRRDFRPGVRCRREGFTLIEILIVIAIIAFLAGTVILATGPIFRKAARQSTDSMVQRLQTYISEYQRLRGELPPDGLDQTVRTKDGYQLESSAALYHALTQPIIQVTEVAGEDKVLRLDPVAEFAQGELSDEDPNEPGVRYILDGFGEPFHYDNQERKVSLPELVDEDPGIDSPVGRWKGPGYEIWSIGWRISAAEEWEEADRDADEPKD